MKTFILSFLLSISMLSSKSQSMTITDTIIYETGNELYKYHQKKTTGRALILIGGTLALIGNVFKENETFQAPFYIIGAGATLIGGIISTTASKHVGNAGVMLMALSGNRNLDNKFNRKYHGRKRNKH